MAMSETILRARGLVKEYAAGLSRVRVLRSVDLTVRRGEFLCILGPSGSGKSTLLHLLGLLDRPTEGRVEFEGQDAFVRPKRWRDRMRSEAIGFVFQLYYLMPDLSVLGNTLLVAMIRTPAWRWPAARAAHRRRACQVLGELGLAHRLHHLPRELSGGEQQRAAIARALVHQPRVLFADEPTGNLDSATGEEIMRVLGRLHHERGLTIVMVTHDAQVAARADRVLDLVDGKLLTQRP
jgi:ABC-type lipoprotein export system ATPase subunit